MRVAYLRALLRRSLALFAIPAELLASPVIRIPHFRCPTQCLLNAGILHKVKSILTFNYQITNLPNYQIFLPHPGYGLDYDSKRLSVRHPRKIAFNPAPIASNRHQTASNLPSLLPLAYDLWFGVTNG
jgi:hypothetical protein